MAMLSAAAYCTAGQRATGCTEYTMPEGWTIAYESPVIAFVATKTLADGTEIGVLVYRGTDTNNKTDLSTGASSAADFWIQAYGAKVARGYYYEVQKPQLDALNTACPVDTCYQYITGHSKGGATAQIAAFKLCYEYPGLCEDDQTTPITYTFGAPPGVGGILSDGQGIAALIGPKMFKYINGDDCIPFGWAGDAAIGTMYPIGGSSRGLFALGKCGMSSKIESHKIQSYIASLQNLY